MQKQAPRWVKWGGIVIGVLLVGFSLFWLVAYLISPPCGGEAFAKKAGLPHPTIVAHRGASYYAPEETEPAYILARKLGADYLELDLQRTKDGVLVAFHDKYLTRTTDVAKVFSDRKKAGIGDFTYAELQRLDAGSWFNRKYPKRARKKYQGLRILTLDQIITIAEQGTHKPGLYIETKGPKEFPGIEKQLVETLTKRGWLANGAPRIVSSTPVPGRVTLGLGKARVLFQSFEAASLTLLKQYAPGVPRVYLIGSWMVKKHGWKPLLKRAKELGMGIGPVGYKAFFWHTGPAHKEGLIVHPYTIDVPWQMRLLLQFGADGFFTNRPDVGLRIVRRYKNPPTMDILLTKMGYTLLGS